MVQARKTKQEALGDLYRGRGFDGEGIPQNIYNPDSKEMVIARIGGFGHYKEDVIKYEPPYVKPVNWAVIIIVIVVVCVVVIGLAAWIIQMKMHRPIFTCFRDPTDIALRARIEKNTE